jgi:hypothetical protein
MARSIVVKGVESLERLLDEPAYARALPTPVERCGGEFVAYYLPTKIASKVPRVATPEIERYYNDIKVT